MNVNLELSKTGTNINQISKNLNGNLVKIDDDLIEKLNLNLYKYNKDLNLLSNEISKIYKLLAN